MLNIFNDTFKDTILYYSGNTLENKIKVLENKLKNTKSKEEKLYLYEEIQKYKYGIQGENKILYELKNSHIPMYILHDINLEYKDYKAQIDFIILTKKNYYIIECKNLYGNISIDNKGNFYRINNKNKVGIYNPITQLDRHINIIRRYIEDRNNFIGKLIVKKIFDSMYHGIVVLANDNTVVEDKYAPKNVKNKVIRADQLIEYIKYIEKNTDSYASSEKDIISSCNNILALCKKEETIAEERPLLNINEDITDNNKTININNDDEIRTNLKKYRLNKSKELNYKPYFIFSDKTLEELINKKPKNKVELKQIEGFGDKKIEMYGIDIIKIINN